MKRILFSLLLTLVTLGANAEPRYTITGSLTNQGNARIILLYLEGDRLVTNAVLATNGAFTLSGPAPARPIVARLNTGLDRNVHLGLTRNSMFMPAPLLEIVLSSNSSLTLSGDAQEIHLAKVEGDELNAGFTALRQAETENVREHTRLMKQFADFKIMGAEERIKEELGPKMVENRNAQIAIRKKFITEHPAAFVSLWLLSTMNRGEFDPATLKSLYDQLDPKLKAGDLGKEVEAQIENPRPRAPRHQGTNAAKASTHPVPPEH
jgi:hypothetical protein